MGKVTKTLACVGLAVMLAIFGYVAGRKSAKVDISKMETTTCDTLWREIHDTAFIEKDVKISRMDTVKLAVVGANGYENAFSGTYPEPNGYENGISGTYRDTLFIHDSVFVEVPIEQKTFVGDHWMVRAHGYRVGLDDVWVERPTVYVTKTQTRTKRWSFSVGGQIGYGYTTHGASPYIGIGAGFGYTF